MILLSILFLIVAMALPSFNKHISPILFTRLATIVLIYSGVLAFNTFYIQSIGSGIGVYSGSIIDFIENLIENNNLGLDSLNDYPKISILSFLVSKSSTRSPLIYLIIFIINLIFLIFLISFIINIIYMPYLELNHPLIYIALMNHLGMYYSYYLLALIFWLIIVSFYNVVELYFFCYHCNSNNDLNLPKYLPRFIKNNFILMYKQSKYDTKDKLGIMRVLFASLTLSLSVSYISFFCVFFSS